MKFIDEVTIRVKAGDGGRGCLSFRREKFIPLGGPDGGDGGKGGDVVLRVDSSLNTLMHFRNNAHYKAQSGSAGMGKNRHGKNGDAVELLVPPGTLIYNRDTGELLADLTRQEQEIVLLRGGRGGRGNARFVSSVNRAPRRTDPGEEGLDLWLRLELKLLADVGLVGMPNAGKSTLISAVSAARPKIADYPFTTLVPNLGVVTYQGYRTFVMADIPGLIEGASEGHGLGTRFLKHVERTDLFLHLLDITPMEGADPLKDFETINAELRRHSESMADKVQIVVLTKCDITDVRQRAEELRPYFLERGYRVFDVSAVTGEGIPALVEEVGRLLEQFRSREDGASSEN